MPIAVKKSDNRTELEGMAQRRDSTFDYDHTAPSERLQQEEMYRLRATALSRSSEHIRTESVDSGIGGMAANTVDINLAVKAVSLI